MSTVKPISDKFDAIKHCLDCIPASIDSKTFEEAKRAAEIALSEAEGVVFNSDEAESFQRVSEYFSLRAEDFFARSSYHEAAQLYRKSLDLSNPADKNTRTKLYIKICQSYVLLKNIDDAYMALNEALKEAEKLRFNPENAEQCNELSRGFNHIIVEINIVFGMLPDQWLFLQKALELSSPDDRSLRCDIHYNICLAAIKFEQLDLAKKSALAFLSEIKGYVFNPDNPEEYKETCLYTKAGILFYFFQNGADQIALSLLQKVLTLNPADPDNVLLRYVEGAISNHAESQCFMAEWFEKKGQHEIAVRWWHKAAAQGYFKAQCVLADFWQNTVHKAYDKKNALYEWLAVSPSIHNLNIIYPHELFENALLSSSTFGQAVRCIWSTNGAKKDVVVKVPRNLSSSYVEDNFAVSLIDEWSAFCHVPPHPNVLSLIGLCPSFKCKDSNRIELKPIVSLVSPFIEQGSILDFFKRPENKTKAKEYLLR